MEHLDEKEQGTEIEEDSSCSCSSDSSECSCSDSESYCNCSDTDDMEASTKPLLTETEPQVRPPETESLMTPEATEIKTEEIEQPLSSEPKTSDDDPQSSEINTSTRPPPRTLVSITNNFK